MMRKLQNIVIVSGLLAFLYGCAAKTVQDVGTGMQLGSMPGTPLSPVVAAAGIATEIVGRMMDSEGTVEPASPEHDAALKRGMELIIKQECYHLLRVKLQPTPDTTPEQMTASAQAVCKDVDTLVAEGVSLKMSRERIRKSGWSEKSLSKLMPGGESDEYLVFLKTNPFGNNCRTELEAAGARFVEMEKKKRKG